MKPISNLLPDASEVRLAPAANQLQLFFDEIHDKKQKIRELKAVVKEQLGKDDAYVKAKDSFTIAKDKLKSAKQAASKDLGGELDKIDELTTSIQLTEDSAATVALGRLQEGEDVEITTRSGKKVRAELRVRFVEEKDAGEADDNE